MVGAVVAVLAAVLLGACRVTVGVGVESGAGGTGRVQATVTLDRDAADQVPDLASQLRVGDLTRAGWVVSGPARGADGGAVVRVSKPFGSPSQVPQLITELAGAGGPLHDFRLVQHRGFFITRTRFAGAVDLGPGLEVFGDPQLRRRLGGSSLGVDPAELSRQLGVAVDQVVDVRVSVKLAGSGSITSNAPPGRGGSTAVWRVPLGSSAVLSASGHQYQWRRIEIVIGAGLLLLLLALVFVLRRLRARRHSR